MFARLQFSGRESSRRILPIVLAASFRRDSDRAKSRWRQSGPEPLGSSVIRRATLTLWDLDFDRAGSVICVPLFIR